MAFAEKTIYYALTTGSGTDGLVPADQFKTIGSGVFHIPENSGSTPVTFSSVYVDNFFQDITTATGNNINRTSIALVVSGNKMAISESVSLGNSGEALGGIFGPLNLTSVFTGSTFGAPNYSQKVSFSCETYYTQSGGTTTGMRAVSALIGLTYIYDTNAVTQSKSVIIPLYSRSGSMPSSSNSIHAFIPILRSSSNDYLVEASCSIDQYFIVLEGSTNTNSRTIDISASYAIDAGTARVLPVVEEALATDTWVRYILPFPSESIPNLLTTHSFNLWCGSGNYFGSMTAKLYITYTFIPSISTRTLNYYKIPWNVESPLTGGAIAASSSCNIFERDIMVPEPGPVLLKNSAIEMYWRSTASPSIAIRAESQSIARVYGITTAVIVGNFQLLHGLTSGSYYGTATPFSESAMPNFNTGSNTLRFSLWRTNSNLVNNTTGWIYINYVSDTSSLGIHTHTHTIEYNSRQMSYTAIGEDQFTYKPFLAQLTGSSKWSLNNIGMETNYWDGNSLNFYTLDISIAASESINLFRSASVPVGIRRIYSDFAGGSFENTFGRWVTLSKDFKRYPRDPDMTRLHPTGSRRWRYFIGLNLIYGSKFFISYSNITASVGGNIVSSSGGTINLKLYDHCNNLYDSTTRSGNGAYSFDVYNPHSNYYVTAYEDSAFKGMSKIGTPASDFDISMVTSGSSGTGSVAGYTEYWF